MNNFRCHALLLAASAFLVLGCKEAVADSTEYADFVVASGHGFLFDHTGAIVSLEDEELYLNIYRDVAKLARQHLLPAAALEHRELVDQGLEWLDEDGLTITERLLIAASITEYLHEETDERFRQRYEWLHRILLTRPLDVLTQNLGDLAPDAQSIVHTLDLQALLDTSAPRSYAYIEKCRAEGVPVPDYWSMDRDGPWEYQGAIASNAATVWTWTDHITRGGCISLPRGTITGIICHNAETGKACFWDSLHRSTGANLVQDRGPVPLASFTDADSMGDCTVCHRGDNAFFIAPDDPTWQRTINASHPAYIAGPLFTTKVLPPARFSAISAAADPASGSWINLPAQNGCGLSCHSESNLPTNTLGTKTPMPPSCAKPSVTSDHRCYQ